MGETTVIAPARKPIRKITVRFFLEQVYNEKRLHSALGYRPPVEFEQALASANSKLLQTVSLGRESAV